MLDVQGGCERIQKTPLPTAYVYFSRRLVVFYRCALPFGLIETSGWTMAFAAPAAALCFLLIDVTGALVQTPFSTGFHGLPVSALSTTIERNMRQHLTGKPSLPPPILPSGPTGHILM